ncbi:MAG: bifunctional DNA-formamidopyrimidine glycosylase/DNA-(apurinic or apyrimidinic site) lyase [Planctomycetota bacterium]
MPELPEVETMRRGVAPVAGARIARVTLPRRADVRPLEVSPSPRAFRRGVEGREVAAVARAGKRLVLELSDGGRVVFEPRMTGLALLTDPPSEKHVRARFQLEGGAAPELVLWDRRGLGTLRLHDEEGYRREVLAKLGKDGLALEDGDLEAALGASARPIKVGLLDQAAVAGVGNIYAVEALFAARIDPLRECRALQPAEWRRLRKELVAVLEHAVRYEGSTLGDGTYRNALNQDGSYQSEHRVYGREGERCRRRGCRGAVVRVVLGQRATFYCPACQG